MEIPDSERLKFRFLSRADSELFFQLDQDPEVMRYINGGKPSSREDIRDCYIPRLESYADQSRGWGLWGMEDLESDDFLGWILVRPMYFFDDQMRDDTDLELGWRLFQSAWGKGHATEGASAVMQALILQNACERFSAAALEGNAASIGVMKKLGMEFLKKEVYPDPLGEEFCVFYSRSAR